MKSTLPRILSAIQPSGKLHIGVYLGAIKNWVKLQYDYDSYFCIVDLHAITVQQKPEDLHRQTLELARLYLACGIDTNHSKLFIQSHVPHHTQLGWILSCITHMGELEKMTQYKDKTANKQRPNVGLFTYPVLMAADILLYQADLVPVGEDQMQHIELTRDIAKRFNTYANKNIFQIPKGFVPKQGARIKGLQDPTKKMSKSSKQPNDSIFILDDNDTIRKKISKAVTDTDNKIIYDLEKKPGISNLIDIMSAITQQPISAIENEFKDSNYGSFKKILAKKVIEQLTPIQEKYNDLSDAKVKKILHEHAEIAKKTAEKTLKDTQTALGFVN